jgi:hypothetical protein
MVDGSERFAGVDDVEDSAGRHSNVEARRLSAATNGLQPTSTNSDNRWFQWRIAPRSRYTCIDRAGTLAEFAPEDIRECMNQFRDGPRLHLDVWQDADLTTFIGSDEVDRNGRLRAGGVGGKDWSYGFPRRFRTELRDCLISLGYQVNRWGKIEKRKDAEGTPLASA